MLSKNNQIQQTMMHSQKKQRWALRKLSYGVASVLVGFTLFGFSQNVSADTTGLNATVSAEQISAVNNGFQDQNQKNNEDTQSAVPSSDTTTPVSENKVTSPETSSNQSTTPAPAVETQSNTPAQNTEASQYNTADWNVDANNVITLKNQPAAGSTVYVPNSVDFGHEVVLTPAYVKQLTGWGVSNLFIDQRGNGTVKAQAGDWSDAFAGSVASATPAGPWITLDLKNLDTSDVTSMYRMFKNNPNLVTVGDISNWNVSNVTSLAEMFMQLPKFAGHNGSMDLSKWDTHSVTDTSLMFTVGAPLESIDLHGWDISSLTNANRMFNGNNEASYNSLYTGNHIKSIDISGWHTDGATMPLNNVSQMFKGNEGLTTIKGIADLLAKPNNVTSLDGMFWDCGSLSSLDLSKWDTSKVTNLSTMFMNDKNLQNVKGIGDW